MPGLFLKAAVLVGLLALGEQVEARAGPLMSSPVADSPLAVQESSVLTGRVVDLPTGASLFMAIVTVEGTDRGTTTDSTGRYRIDGLRPGSYLLRIVRIGYKPLMIRRQVVPVGTLHMRDLSLSQLVFEGCIWISHLNEPATGLLAPFSTAIVRFGGSH